MGVKGKETELAKKKVPHRGHLDPESARIRAWVQTGRSRAWPRSGSSPSREPQPQTPQGWGTALTCGPWSPGQDDAAKPDCPSFQIAKPARLQLGGHLYISACDEAGGTKGHLCCGSHHQADKEEPSLILSL